MTEVGGQKSGVRDQREEEIEIRIEEIGDRGEVRRQTTDDRGRKSEGR